MSVGNEPEIFQLIQSLAPTLAALGFVPCNLFKRPKG
jgi:hypothetical protein